MKELICCNLKYCLTKNIKNKQDAKEEKNETEKFSEKVALKTEKLLETDDKNTKS